MVVNQTDVSSTFYDYWRKGVANDNKLKKQRKAENRGERGVQLSDSFGKSICT
jgi:hypothetical protein